MKLTDLFESRSIIFESGDKPYAWTLDFHTPTLYTYVFQPNPNYDFKYEVRLTKSWGIPEFTNHWWNIDFGVFGHYTSMNEIDPYDLNGLAEQGIVSSIRIFGTIADIIRDFFSQKSVPGLEFTAVDSKRIKLYKRMLPILAHKCHMEYEIRETKPNGRGQVRWLYKLIKPKLDESVRMDGFWITTLPDLPFIYTDHKYNIHHDHLAREYFKQDKPGDPRPLVQALQAGWIRVNVVSRYVGVQFHVDAVSRNNIRRLLDFIKDYSDRTFNVDEDKKFVTMTYREFRARLQEIMKHAVTETIIGGSPTATGANNYMNFERDQMQRIGITDGYDIYSHVDEHNTHWFVMYQGSNKVLISRWIPETWHNESYMRLKFIYIFSEYRSRELFARICWFVKQQMKLPIICDDLVSRAALGAINKLKSLEIYNFKIYWFDGTQKKPFDLSTIDQYTENMFGSRTHWRLIIEQTVDSMFSPLFEDLDSWSTQFYTVFEHAENGHTPITDLEQFQSNFFEDEQYGSVD